MKVVTVREILEAASRMAGVDLRTRVYARQVCTIRNAAYRAAREMTGRAYPMIGRIFVRHHATILTGARRADPAVVAQIVARIDTLKGIAA